MFSLFAQAAVWPAGWSFASIAIAIVVIAAVCALVFVALRQFGIAIPAWVAQVLWIVVIAFVIIVAIRLVMSF